MQLSVPSQRENKSCALLSALRALTFPSASADRFAESFDMISKTSFKLNVLAYDYLTVAITTDVALLISRICRNEHNEPHLACAALSFHEAATFLLLMICRIPEAGAEMDCPLQTVHMCLLKGILGVKRTTPNWSVLHECAQEPLQFYWFQAAVRFYNSLLCSNSSTLAKVLKADNAMNTINKKCRSAEFLDAFHGLERSGDFQHCVRTLQTVTSVACSNSRQKTRSFPVSLHANVFVEASICRLVSQFTTGIQNSCQSYWSFLFLPSLF